MEPGSDAGGFVSRRSRATDRFAGPPEGCADARTRTSNCGWSDADIRTRLAGGDYALADERPIRKAAGVGRFRRASQLAAFQDRKSTRLNSSHLVISYAVFCL